jgi:hypothetical protein
MTLSISARGALDASSSRFYRGPLQWESVGKDLENLCTRQRQVGFVYVCTDICRHSPGSFIARITHHEIISPCLGRGKHRENDGSISAARLRFIYAYMPSHSSSSSSSFPPPLPPAAPLPAARFCACVAFPQNPLCRADTCLVAVARAGRTRGRTGERDGRAVGRRAGMGLRGRGYCRLDRIGLVGGQIWGCGQGLSRGFVVST